MKTLSKYSNYFGIALVLCVMVISGCSCSVPKAVPPPNPLANFHLADLRDLHSNKVITDDYKSYIQTLSSDEQKYAGPILFYEDGTGQHAVEIKIGLNGTVWLHILIYDKDNKRIKTVKHAIGHYAS